MKSRLFIMVGVLSAATMFGQAIGTAPVPAAVPVGAQIGASAAVPAGIPVAAVTATATATATTTTTTKTVVTETVVTQKAVQPFMKICVLEFNTVDKVGLKALESKFCKPVQPVAQSLNVDDRVSIDKVMQGFVKLMDAKATNDARATGLERENAMARAQFETTLKGAARPSIIGDEYLTAFLGRHSDVFGCMDKNLVAAEMMKLKNEPDFPKDFMLKLNQRTGLTHLIYATVSDIRSKENSFKGYGIETKTTVCQLDVIVKVVDLVKQHTVFSNVYTGVYREQRPISVDQFDNNIFQNLMTSALEQAAEELYEKCSPDNPEGLFRKTVVTQEIR